MSENLIKFVDFGIANVIEGKIEINKDLKKHPKLYERVLLHEMNHIKGDRNADFKDKFDPKLLIWVMTHPSSWTQFLPIWFRGGIILYNRGMLYLWAIGLTLILFLFIAIKLPYMALWLAVFYVLLALGMLIWLYR